jgi:hypothetical protein
VKYPTLLSAKRIAIGDWGNIIIEVFNSNVTAPAAEAAGTDDDGTGEGAPPPVAGVELKVFTVLISVLVGKEVIREM